MIASNRPPEPFPWLCPRCGLETVNPVTIAYKATRTHEGCAYDFTAPGVIVFECSNCGEQLFNSEAHEQIERAFRAVLGLLQPGEIRDGRKQLRLSQKEFAAKLRFAEESVSRWETGALVQSRHADVLIRVYFASPLLRRLLDRVGDTPDLGRAVCHEEPPANGKHALATQPRAPVDDQVGHSASR